MVHRAREVRIRKGDSPKRRATQDIAWSRFAVRAEEESRLWAQICVTPAIEDDCGDVAARIETSP